jgi:hypothetical protein
MEDSALRSHIAYSAAEGKSPFVMAGAGAVVQILKVSGLVKEQDGKLVADPSARQDLAYVPSRTTVKQQEKEENVEKAGPPPAGTTAQMHVAPNLSVSIQIQIQCTAAEVSELGPKLRALLKEVKEDPKPESQ